MFVVELIFRLTFTGGLRSGDVLEGGRRQSVPRVARGTWQSVRPSVRRDDDVSVCAWPSTR